MFEKWNAVTTRYSLAITIAVNAAATDLSSRLMGLGLPEVNIVMVYLLAVLVISCSTKGYIYGVVTAIVSMLSFNFFFSQPELSFNVYDTTYLFTFVAMLSLSILITTLTTKLMNMTALARQSERLAREKEAAQAVIKEEQLKNDLLRAISHDLRTPLTSIAGSAEMLLLSLPEGEERKTAAAIHSDAAWLTRLVENILSLTRIQEGQLQVNIRPELVEEVVESAATRMQKYYPQTPIQVQVPDAVLLVPMDARLIEQVLINLLDNAAKHSAPGQPIQLTVTGAKDQVLFTITDEGDGLAPQDLPHLFEAFYTKAGHCGDDRRGIGLGLAICQTIIAKHGGLITAQNRPQGGACFQFSLPVKGELTRA